MTRTKRTQTVYATIEKGIFSHKQKTKIRTKERTSTSMKGTPKN